MKTIQKTKEKAKVKAKTKTGKPVGTDFFKRSWEESWTYIKTVVDVVREPVLILDKNFRVMAANESFYEMFQVEPKDTEKKIVYDLGNGQWNIPALRKLLENILPNNTFFKGFEVAHEFAFIGHKTMILNARRIYKEGHDSQKSGTFPPIIMLAIEDVTEMMAIAKKLADHTNQFEYDLTEQTHTLTMRLERLEKEVKGFSGFMVKA
jgi:nitrogen-specific signal transduction histidine kinase